MLLRYLIAWLGMAALAVANGVFRELFLAPRYASDTAYQLSTALLLAVLALYFWLLFRLWPLKSKGQAWGVGALWLVLTIAFEFGLGLMGGLSWPEMLAQYHLANGVLWILVPAFVLVGPRLFVRRGKR